MAIGALWSIVQIRRQLVDGIRSALAGLSHSDGPSAPQSQDADLGQGTIWSFISAGIVIAAGAYFLNVGPLGAGISTLYTVLAVFFFVAISVYIVGLIGSTNQPVSGITIYTFLPAALFLFGGRIAGAEAVRYQCDRQRGPQSDYVPWKPGSLHKQVLMGEYLRRCGSSFGISPMAVAVGIYLPFTTTLPILLGGLVHFWATRSYRDPQKLEMAIQTGTVLCAGLVAGEALTGIFLAVPIGPNIRLPLACVGSELVRNALSILTLLALPWAVYRSIAKQMAGRK